MHFYNLPMIKEISCLQQLPLENLSFAPSIFRHSVITIYYLCIFYIFQLFLHLFINSIQIFFLKIKEIIL